MHQTTKTVVVIFVIKGSNSLPTVIRHKLKSEHYRRQQPQVNNKK